MSTRAHIGRQIPGGVRYVYLHWDGYPEGAGETLKSHYTDPAKVDSLIALGDLSSLGPEVETTEPHTYDHPADGVTVAYHRDRGEPMRGPYLGESVPEDGVAYRYLFTLDHCWLVAARGKDYTEF